MSHLSPLPEVDEAEAAGVTTESMVKEKPILTDICPCCTSKANMTLKESSNRVDGSQKAGGSGTLKFSGFGAFEHMKSMKTKPSLDMDRDEGTVKKKQDPGTLRASTSGTQGNPKRTIGTTADNESVAESSDTDKWAQTKKRLPLPCRSCRMSCCCNCLVPFKNGDKIVTKIPSKGQDDTYTGKSILIEAALASVFNPHNPYPRWVRMINRMSTVISQMVEIFIGKLEDEEEQFFDQQEKQSKDTEKKPVGKMRRSMHQVRVPLHDFLTSFFEQLGVDHLDHNVNRPEEMYVELTKDSFKGIKIPIECMPNLDEVKAFILEKLNAKKKETENKRELSAKRICDVINAKPRVKELDLRMCVGCAEILAVLFTAWENLQAKVLTEENYFSAVLLGFQSAKKAQDVIFRAPPSSKMFICDKYGREVHPIGCHERFTKQGIKMFSRNKRDSLVKLAVGNLHGYLEESYRLVDPEQFRTQDTEFEYDCEDENDLDQEDLEEEEEEPEVV